MLMCIYEPGRVISFTSNGLVNSTNVTNEYNISIDIHQISRNSIPFYANFAENRLIMSWYSDCITQEQLKKLECYDFGREITEIYLYVDEVFADFKILATSVDIVYSIFGVEPIVFSPQKMRELVSEKRVYKTYFYDWMCISWSRHAECILRSYRIENPTYKMSCLNRITENRPAKPFFAAYANTAGNFVTFGKCNEEKVRQQFEDFSKHTGYQVDKLYKSFLQLNEKPKLVGSYREKDASIPIISSAYVNIVTETLFFIDTPNFSEKALKATLVKRPFILCAPPGTLQLMKDLGFRTFDRWWDESYDLEPNHYKRICKIFGLIDYINSLTHDELSVILNEMEDVLEYNKRLLPNLKEQYDGLLNEQYKQARHILHGTMDTYLPKSTD